MNHRTWVPFGKLRDGIANYYATMGNIFFRVKKLIQKKMVPKPVNQSTFCKMIADIVRLLISVTIAHYCIIALILQNFAKGTQVLILIQQYFIPIDQVRCDEINTCLQSNIDNTEIDEIHLLNENIYDIELLRHPKIKQINIGKRLTFVDAFRYGNKLQDCIKIVSNSDISFDQEGLRMVKTMDLTKRCLALNRYDIIQYEPLKIELYVSEHSKQKGLSDAQDAWIFTQIVCNRYMKFYLGQLGCDNYLAYLLSREGMIVSNPCSNIKIYHHHLSGKRYYAEENRVGRSKEYLFLSYD